jgi:aminoglycoside phosphotransferase family enzyme
MSDELSEDVFDNAEAAVALAQQVRRFHRRRSNRYSQHRAADIDHALNRLREAMAPLRSESGRFHYGPQTDAAEAKRQRVREASAALQRERRKLWKMRPVTQDPV